MNLQRIRVRFMRQLNNYDGVSDERLNILQLRAIYFTELKNAKLMKNVKL